MVHQVQCDPALRRSAQITQQKCVSPRGICYLNVFPHYSCYIDLFLPVQFGIWKATI